MLGLLRKLLHPLAWMALGVFLALLAGSVLYLNGRPDLAVWHTAELDEEFRAGAGVGSFEAYLALEQRLFAQLQTEVYDRVPEALRSPIGRYTRGSRSDPASFERDWNRSFELEVVRPAAGFLLVHGMSDSPYSLRHLAMRLHGAGAHVLALRMPGHGTAPSGLARARWRDMAAAVRIGARRVGERVGDRPIFLVGYSNGAALAVHYALLALDDVTLPRPEGLVLLSPMIGISRAAALAIWQERIGRLLGLDKLQWNSVSPEIDPFKYGSFAVNAGDQSYRLTVEIGRLLDGARQRGRLSELPRILALQSAADGTVSTPALIDGLMARLAPGGHQLVIFDVNRRTESVNLLAHDPGPELRRLLGASDRNFTLAVVTNAAPTDPGVILRSLAPGSAHFEESDLGLAWPRDVFSLSHVALPFPEHDPVYGAGPGDGRHATLGNLALRGERGVLAISPGEMLRLRWNPFYAWLESVVLRFVGLDG